MYVSSLQKTFFTSRFQENIGCGCAPPALMCMQFVRGNIVHGHL